jgi:hypothetical protein
MNPERHSKPLATTAVMDASGRQAGQSQSVHVNHYRNFTLW